MHAIRAIIGAVWVAFWLYWLGAAAAEIKGRIGGHARRARLRGLAAILILIVLVVVRGRPASTHSIALALVGLAVEVAGLALCVWARVHLGRNWGMPMTRRADPDLVTSGPYSRVRHPIYTGLMFAVFGSALAISPFSLLFALVIAGYFYYCARIEEQNLAERFPIEYPAYRARTKMLIPYLF